MSVRVFRWLSLVLPCLALAVIVFGAYVRLSDAGLGCPDWPGCYGRLTVPEQAPDVHLEDPAWQHRPLESGKAWREMIHRYLASTLGLGIVVLALLACVLPVPRTVRWLALVLVPLVVLQGVLGMWTVTLLLKPLIVCAHLLGGFATLALLCAVYLAGRPTPPASPLPAHVGLLARIALLVFIGQVFLGGWTSANYAALACTDFPTCHGRWWPDTDFAEAFVLWRGLGINYEFGVLDTPARTAIHIAHRAGAVLTALVVALTALMSLRSVRLRRQASCILALLVAQVGLGITNVVKGLPLGVAVAHNGVAAMLLVALVTLVYTTTRMQRP